VTFSIRGASASDAEGILACLHSAFQPYESTYTRDAYEDTVLKHDSLHRRLKTMSIFVAVSESGEIVGTIGCEVVHEAEGHLRGMAVRPEWQGSGVAKQLLDRAESELRDRGCLRITLDTTEPLKRAVQFYEKNGYRASGKVTDFFGMPLFQYLKTLEEP
jgi:GNAT superfamily N-acetyltransferase